MTLRRGSNFFADFVLDLERLPGGVRIACVLHRYHEILCPCGTDTAARPGKGLVSILAGRKQNLQLSEAGLVGPALATFIAALAVRYRLSRAKIAELLVTWFGVRLSAGTIDRCIREAGLACEPIAKACSPICANPVSSMPTKRLGRNVVICAGYGLRGPPSVRPC